MLLAAATWLALIVVATRDRQAVASDDAFIAFQYARHLARGDGLVFNLGERVWGFTSPLHTLLLAALTRLGADTVRAAFVSGFLWVAVTALLLYRVSCAVLPPALALCVGLFFLLEPSQHGTYTLESTLLGALQLAFLCAVLAPRPAAASVLAALSCLARPDSLLLVVPILLIGRETRRPRHLLLFAAVGLLWEGFAYTYYGALLPNSLRAKHGLTPFGPFFANAFAYVTNGTLLAVPGLAAWERIGRTVPVLLNGLVLLNAELRRRPALAYALVLYPWLLIGAYSAIGSAVGHNWEIYSARLFLQAGAAIGLLSAAHLAADRLRLRPGWRQLAAAALFIVILARGAQQTNLRFQQLSSKDTSHWGGARYDAYRMLADWIAANAPPGASVALREVGTFAYYSDANVIDVSGIVTRDYAPQDRGDTTRFLQRFAPDYAVVFGDTTELHAGDHHYRRVVLFPDRGYVGLSLLARDP
jgi:hypothetical protein